MSKWHSAYFSPYMDGMGGNYWPCNCTDGKHHHSNALTYDSLNQLEVRAALADEAAHYSEFVRPFSNEDEPFWTHWMARYDALPRKEKS